MNRREKAALLNVSCNYNTDFSLRHQRVMHTTRADCTFKGIVSPEDIFAAFGNGPINGVDRIIFNGPATIILWANGEKTVVKCSECMRDKCPYNDVPDPELFCHRYDREKAVMAAILKRSYKGWQDVARKYIEED